MNALQPLVVDAHEDLAWNMLTFGRDYTRPAAQTRQSEKDSLAPQVNDDVLLGWPDYLRGRVALVFASLFAAPAQHQAGPWELQYYTDDIQAERLYLAQLDAYWRLADEHPDKFRLVQTHQDLAQVLSAWESFVPPSHDQENAPGSVQMPAVGLVILMEGAEAVRQPQDLENWWQRGVRIIGPSWMGNRYGGGTRQPGPLTADGFALLEGMAQYGFVLDLAHMDEKAALQALDAYPGAIIASHSNALALLKGSTSNRHLSDRLLQGILERDGVIGINFFGTFLKFGWVKGQSRLEISLQQVVNQIDYICQMAGDARHVGIGSDFDGGFGLQSVPHEIDTVADLQKLVPLLSEKGYTDTAITAILGSNWIDLLRKTLPEARG
ncbi:MAG: membrane dipeptidase [Chloroflexota bacterium]